MDYSTQELLLLLCLLCMGKCEILRASITTEKVQEIRPTRSIIQQTCGNVRKRSYTPMIPNTLSTSFTTSMIQNTLSTSLTNTPINVFSNMQAFHYQEPRVISESSFRTIFSAVMCSEYKCLRKVSTKSDATVMSSLSTYKSTSKTQNESNQPAVLRDAPPYDLTISRSSENCLFRTPTPIRNVSTTSDVPRSQATTIFGSLLSISETPVSDTFRSSVVQNSQLQIHSDKLLINASRTLAITSIKSKKIPDSSIIHVATTSSLHSIHSTSSFDSEIIPSTTVSSIFNASSTSTLFSNQSPSSPSISVASARIFPYRLYANSSSLLKLNHRTANITASVTQKGLQTEHALLLESSTLNLIRSQKASAGLALKKQQDLDTIELIPVKNLKVQMELAVKDIYTDDLNNRNSPRYMELHRRLHGYLTTVLNTTKGLKSIDITGFRNGSVVAMYTIFLDNLSKDAATKEIKHVIDKTAISFDVARRFNITVSFIETLKLLREKLKTFQSTSACGVYDRACPFGYNCSTVPKSISKVSCKKKCSSENPPCGKNGECYVHYLDEVVRCRCKESDSHVYSGKFCETATEKLKLKSNTIVIICASGAGILLLIVFILSVCIVRVKMRNRRKNRNGADRDRFNTVSMNDLHSFGSYDGPRSRTTTVHNSYDSGLPSTKFVDGREHRLLRGRELGSESYIYTPSLTTTRDPQTTDTDGKFEIHRPDVRHGSKYRYW